MSIHPHGCGATREYHDPSCFDVDSSPRMWGYPFIKNGRNYIKRFIPTDVGLPLIDDPQYISTAIHPHGCGATGIRKVNPESRIDSSPRMWGYPSVIFFLRKLRRFIPTDVGLPFRAADPPLLGAIHPHGCGATRFRHLRNLWDIDSSPRMWGYQRRRCWSDEQIRFIPTDVGLPFRLISCAQYFPIHPHGCGATLVLGIIKKRTIDSSPRMWGYHKIGEQYGKFIRFIPTDVGLPYRGSPKPF